MLTMDTHIIHISTHAHTHTHCILTHTHTQASKIHTRTHTRTLGHAEHYYLPAVKLVEAFCSGLATTNTEGITGTAETEQVYVPDCDDCSELKVTIEVYLCPEAITSLTFTSSPENPDPEPDPELQFDSDVDPTPDPEAEPEADPDPQSSEDPTELYLTIE